MKKPRMTLDDVLLDMRELGMKMNKKHISQCMKDGTFPFGKVISVGPTGRTTFLIMRKDYERWANEFLNF